MPFPKHVAWSPLEMAAWIRTEILAQPPGRLHLLEEKQVPPEFASNRLTRVPFWMTAVDRAFNCRVVSKNCRLTIRPGDTVLFAPSTHATALIDRACEFFRITVEPEGLFIGREVIRNVPVSSLPPEGHPYGTLYAVWIERSLPQPAAGLLDRLLAGPEPEAATSIHRTLLWEILALLEAPSLPCQHATSRATTILRYLRDSCDRPINRETVAASFNLSPGYLGRIVREATGRSFQDVLLQFRIDRASWLLRYSAIPINEIALRSGFNSANYFTQAFRKAREMSPRDFRNGSHSPDESSAIS